MNISFFVILLSLSCLVNGCDIGDFPTRQKFSVFTYVDFLYWHTGDDGSPAWRGSFELQLANATQCRYIGSWPECNASFVGFYDPSSKALRGGWAILEHDWFGSIDYKWDGKTLAGYWSGYPDVLGYDSNIPIEWKDPVPVQKK
eukprot:g5968.t1